MATIRTDDSLATRFASLEREREQTWSAEDLSNNRAQRRALREAFDPARAVKVGDVAPDFHLNGSQGGVLSSKHLLADGPVVLIFVRFAGCAADNIALPLYDQTLSGPLRKAGVGLIAVSPQLPEKLDAIRERHGLKLAVATDRDNGLARAFGLTFTPLATPDPPPPGWIGETTGTGSWELPQAAVLIIDRERRVRFVAVSPDWLDRIEPEAILEALEMIHGDVIGQAELPSNIS